MAFHGMKPSILRSPLHWWFWWWFNGCYLVQLQVDNLWGVFVLNYTLRYELNVIWIVYEMNCIKKIFHFSKLLVDCEERWVKVFLWQKFKMAKSVLWLHSPLKKSKMLTFGNASPIFKADPSFLLKGLLTPLFLAPIPILRFWQLPEFLPTKALHGVDLHQSLHQPKPICETHHAFIT